MQIRLRGAPAVLVLVAIGAFTAWRSTTAYTDLENGAAQELTQWLRGEYARDRLRDITTVEDLTPAMVDSLLTSQNVTFESVRARGASDDMVVRAEVLVDGRSPSDGHVRYYRMSYSTITGWRMERETHAFLYYTRLF